jgi:hypothetical protein
MRRSWFILTAAGLLTLASAAPVAAQFPARPGGPASTLPPAYSPYLNLLRPDNPTYANYYGLVRPEQEFRGNIQNLQRQQTQTEDEVTGINTNAGLAATGHQTSFLNTGGYFQSRSGRGTGTGGTGTAGTGGGQASGGVRPGQTQGTTASTSSTAPAR